MNRNSEVWYNSVKMIWYGRLGEQMVTGGNKQEVEQKIEELKKDLNMCDDCDLAHPNCNKCIGA